MEELCVQNGTTLAEEAVKFAFCFDEPALTLMGMGRESSVLRNLELYNKEPNWLLVEQIRSIFRDLRNPFNTD